MKVFNWTERSHKSDKIENLEKNSNFYQFDKKLENAQE